MARAAKNDFDGGEVLNKAQPRFKKKAHNRGCCWEEEEEEEMHRETISTRCVFALDAVAGDEFV